MPLWQQHVVVPAPAAGASRGAVDVEFGDDVECGDDDVECGDDDAECGDDIVKRHDDEIHDDGDRPDDGDDDAAVAKTHIAANAKSVAGFNTTTDVVGNTTVVDNGEHATGHDRKRLG